jgi:tetratricopeptide (TPR) repeat protein
MRLVSRGQDTGLAARIPRTRFNFPPHQTTRPELFQRRVIAQQGAVVLEQPGAGKRVASPQIGQVLEADGMQQGWFRVRIAGGGQGYVDNRKVDVPPRYIETATRPVKLLAAPARTAATVGQVQPKGAYQVLDMRYIPAGGLWYRAAASGAEGWIPAFTVLPRFSLPAVHFVAGIYRYQVGRWSDAAREFEQYIGFPDVEADNASLATAYQLLGASRLLEVPNVKMLEKDSRWDLAFGKAIELTPYDPAAYTLRALSGIAVRGSLGVALGDMSKALELDPQHADTRKLVASAARYTSGRPSPLTRLVRESPSSVRGSIDSLADRYQIRPE